MNKKNLAKPNKKNTKLALFLISANIVLWTLVAICIK